MGGKKYNGVRKASNSSIEIDFYYRGKRCKERIKLKPTPTNLNRAERHRYAILESIENGDFDYSVTFPNSKQFAVHKPAVTDSTSLLQFHLENWLENIEIHVASSTYDGYRKIVNNVLIPNFGSIPIQDFKRLHIKDWGKKLTVSNKRISNILSPLRTMLDEAVEDEIISTNPLSGWRYKHKEKPKTESDVDPFSPVEIKEILNALSDQSKNLIQFAFWTGLRTSEYIALNWQDIDLINGIVKVNKALTQAAKKAESTKTAAGTREVKLLPLAMEAIRAQKKHTYLKNEEVFQNPYTFTRWTGDPQIRRVWTMALKKAVVRYRRPYQTRHTYASMMLSAGESPMWVSSQMGHKDWTMIARVYGKWIPESNPHAGEMAAELFGQKC